MELLSFSLTARKSKACFRYTVFVFRNLLDTRSPLLRRSDSQQETCAFYSKFSTKKADAFNGHLAWGIETVHNAIVEIRVVLKTERKEGNRVV